MNLSFEGVAGNATIRSAAEYALNHGALVVAASGNCGCVDATADNPFILSVSATDETGGVAYFSSTGPYVDLSAPGTNILTTAVGGLYFSDSGTSLASPVVAGVAALMFSANPALTPAVVTELLEATAFDAGGAGYDTGFGFGRVNAYAAVVAAASYQPPPDTTPPTASITAPAAGATVSGNRRRGRVGDRQRRRGAGGPLRRRRVPGNRYVVAVLVRLGHHAGEQRSAHAAGGRHRRRGQQRKHGQYFGDACPTFLPTRRRPASAISSPAAGATVSGTITVTADASDNVGVTKVDFYVDGVLLRDRHVVALLVCLGYHDGEQRRAHAAGGRRRRRGQQRKHGQHFGDRVQHSS